MNNLITDLQLYSGERKSFSVEDQWKIAKELERLTTERDALLGKTQEWKIIHGNWSDKSRDADWLRLRYFEGTAHIAKLEADIALLAPISSVESGGLVNGTVCKTCKGKGVVDDHT